MNNTTNPNRLSPGECMAAPDAIPHETAILTNIAFLMADSMDTLLMLAEGRIHKAGFHLKFDSKRRYKIMAEAIRRARKATRDFSAEMYEIGEVDKACEECDWFADITLLVWDRVGDSEELMRKLRDTLLAMPSKMDIYDKIVRK